VKVKSQIDGLGKKEWSVQFYAYRNTHHLFTAWILYWSGSTLWQLTLKHLEIMAILAAGMHICRKE